jgi:hypothetical protein
MKHKTLTIGILSGLIGCNNKNNNSTVDNNKSDSIFKFQQKEGFTEIKAGETESVSLNLEKDSLLFLPIIRNFTEDDMYYQTVVNEKMGDKIGAFIAKIEVKPNGNTGIDYVLKSNLAKYKISEDDIFVMALRNLKNAKLKIDGMNDPKTGDKMISVSSQIGLATSILFDNDFVDKLKTNLQTEELHVTIINSGTLFFTAPNNSFEDSFGKIASESNHNDVVEVNASTYLWTNYTLKLIKKYRD